MYKEFNIENWKRKNSYNFFKTYDDPIFNICSHIDITKLYKYCKLHSYSFNLSLLFYSLQAANEMEEFRLRVKDDRVVLYDCIHGGATILNDDETFSFCYLEYYDSLPVFEAASKKKIEAQLIQKELDPSVDLLNLIYYSIIPWISFTSLKHPRKSKANATIPKIAFGKYFTDDNILKIPISVEANHSLMDGFHVGRYLTLFQAKINALI